MSEHRWQKLADNIANYSLDVAPGEKVLIEGSEGTEEFVAAMIRAVKEKGAIPFYRLQNTSIQRDWLQNATIEQFTTLAAVDLAMMKEMDAYVAMRGRFNQFELADVDKESMRLYAEKYNRPVHSEQRVPHTKWTVLIAPTPAVAQQAQMSTAAFNEFYFAVCTLDYGKMSRAMDPLIALMNQTDQVRITGPGTDLTFSIKGQPAVKCAGNKNIPDGEVFTAPVRESVNGRLAYNTESNYQGQRFNTIAFEFQNGKIVRATANETERLNHILDTDAGARYIGEFALGVNPYILKPMGDTLFDEKIAGSFHFTPGSTYDECSNGNHSAIHWDLVCIQRPEFGGGEIYFDGQLIRKDGIFVPQSLQSLNPENLK